MSLLNRYILKKFLRPFLASFAALCLVVFVAQVFERLDRFLSEGVNMAHVLGYLLTSLPFQALQVLPVACLLATLFVVGHLARTREYIAGLAAGLPPERFLGGLFLAGFLISVAALVANETFVPPLTNYARTVYREQIRHLGDWDNKMFTDLFVAGAEGRLWSAKTFAQDTGRMGRVIVDSYAGERLHEQIDAASAQWSKEGWMFSRGVVRIYELDGTSLAAQEKFDKKLFPFQESPSDFALQEPQPEQMNYKSLQRHIQRLSALGVPIRDFEVELYMKMAYPFACLVVVVLGIPLALRGRGSHVKGVAAGLVLAFAYLGCMQFGKAMAQRLIPPWSGAWMANLIFLSVGLFLWWRMRRIA